MKNQPRSWQSKLTDQLRQLEVPSIDEITSIHMQQLLPSKLLVSAKEPIGADAIQTYYEQTAAIITAQHEKEKEDWAWTTNFLKMQQLVSFRWRNDEQHARKTNLQKQLLNEIEKHKIIFYSSFTHYEKQLQCKDGAKWHPWHGVVTLQPAAGRSVCQNQSIHDVAIEHTGNLIHNDQPSDWVLPVHSSPWIFEIEKTLSCIIKINFNDLIWSNEWQFVLKANYPFFIRIGAIQDTEIHWLSELQTHQDPMIWSFDAIFTNQYCIELTWEVSKAIVFEWSDAVFFLRQYESKGIIEIGPFDFEVNQQYRLQMVHKAIEQGNSIAKIKWTTKDNQKEEQTITLNEWFTYLPNQQLHSIGYGILQSPRYAYGRSWYEIQQEKPVDLRQLTQAYYGVMQWAVKTIAHDPQTIVLHHHFQNVQASYHSIFEPIIIMREQPDKPYVVQLELFFESKKNHTQTVFLTVSEQWSFKTEWTINGTQQPAIQEAIVIDAPAGKNHWIIMIHLAGGESIRSLELQIENIQWSLIEWCRANQETLRIISPASLQQVSNEQINQSILIEQNTLWTAFSNDQIYFDLIGEQSQLAHENIYFEYELSTTSPQKKSPMLLECLIEQKER